MDVIEAVVDHRIRRGLGLVALAIGLVCLALSFDSVLALRVAANLLALTSVALLWGAWRAPRRDQRSGGSWEELVAFSPDFAKRLPRGEAQRVMSAAMRRRLVWHAERIGLGALAFWGVAGVVGLLRAA